MQVREHTLMHQMAVRVRKEGTGKGMEPGTEPSEHSMA